MTKFSVSLLCIIINDQLQVLRDGKWIEVDASVLVPGDIISVKLGDIIPADARLLEGDPLKIDQVLLATFLTLLVQLFLCLVKSKPSQIGLFVHWFAVCTNRRVPSCDERTW